MNKLLVKDSIVNIKDSLNSLDIKTDNLTLVISGNVYIKDYDNNSGLNLKIIMSSGSHLLYNRYAQSHLKKQSGQNSLPVNSLQHIHQFLSDMYIIYYQWRNTRNRSAYQ